MVATSAADLWAWRSGLFDFSLPEVYGQSEPQHVRTGLFASDRPARQQRLANLQRHLRARPSLKAADVDLLVELGDLQDSLGHPEDAEQSYSQALTAVSGTDRPGRIGARAWTRRCASGRADTGLLLRLPVYWRGARGSGQGAAHPEGRADTGLRTPWGGAFACHYPGSDRRHSASAWGSGRGAAHPDGRGDTGLRTPWLRSLAITRGVRSLCEALRIRREEQIPVFERFGDVRSLAITRGKIADIVQARGDLDEALRIRATAADGGGCRSGGA